MERPSAPFRAPKKSKTKKKPNKSLAPLDAVFENDDLLLQIVASLGFPFDCPPTCSFGPPRPEAHEGLAALGRALCVNRRVRATALLHTRHQERELERIFGAHRRRLAEWHGRATLAIRDATTRYVDAPAPFEGTLESLFMLRIVRSLGVLGPEWNRGARTPRRHPEVEVDADGWTPSPAMLEWQEEYEALEKAGGDASRTVLAGERWAPNALMLGAQVASEGAGSPRILLSTLRKYRDRLCDLFLEAFPTSLPQLYTNLRTACPCCSYADGRCMHTPVDNPRELLCYDSLYGVIETARMHMSAQFVHVSHALDGDDRILWRAFSQVDQDPERALRLGHRRLPYTAAEHMAIVNFAWFPHEYHPTSETWVPFDEGSCCIRINREASSSTSSKEVDRAVRLLKACPLAWRKRVVRALMLERGTAVRTTDEETGRVAYRVLPYRNPSSGTSTWLNSCVAVLPTLPFRREPPGAPSRYASRAESAKWRHGASLAGVMLELGRASAEDAEAEAEAEAEAKAEAERNGQAFTSAEWRALVVPRPDFDFDFDGEELRTRAMMLIGRGARLVKEQNDAKIALAEGMRIERRAEVHDALQRHFGPDKVPSAALRRLVLPLASVTIKVGAILERPIRTIVSACARTNGEDAFQNVKALFPGKYAQSFLYEFVQPIKRALRILEGPCGALAAPDLPHADFESEWPVGEALVRLLQSAMKGSERPHAREALQDAALGRLLSACCLARPGGEDALQVSAPRTFLTAEWVAETPDAIADGHGHLLCCTKVSLSVAYTFRRLIPYASSLQMRTELVRFELHTGMRTFLDFTASHVVGSTDRLQFECKDLVTATRLRWGPERTLSEWRQVAKELARVHQKRFNSMDVLGRLRYMKILFSELKVRETHARSRVPMTEGGRFDSTPARELVKGWRAAPSVEEAVCPPSFTNFCERRGLDRCLCSGRICMSAFGQKLTRFADARQRRLWEA